MLQQFRKVGDDAVRLAQESLVGELEGPTDRLAQGHREAADRGGDLHALQVVAIMRRQGIERLLDFPDGRCQAHELIPDRVDMVTIARAPAPRA